MFGYIKIYEDELKIKEYKLYRSYYCALCKSIAKYSQIHRFFLSYDMVFFALLLNACSEEKCNFKATSPKCHGSINCFCDNAKSDLLEYLAAFAICIQYHKIKNDVDDGEKKKFAQTIMNSGYQKAKTRYPKISQITESRMQKLLLLEQDNCTDVDVLTNCFSGLFKEAASYAPGVDDDTKQVIGEILFNVVSWVYLLDMYDDMDKDRKTGDFNPLNQGTIDPEIVTQKLVEYIENAKKFTNVLPATSELKIVENILYYGLPVKMKTLGLI